MAIVAKTKQLIVQGSNRIGLLADMAGALAGAKANMNALCCYCAGDQATFMIIADKPAAAKKALIKAGFSVTEDAVIRVVLSNKSGELARASAKVAGVGVDIEYVYATAAGKNSAVIIKSKDDAAAIKALRKI
jgi:hypothetical protein